MERRADDAAGSRPGPVERRLRLLRELVAEGARLEPERDLASTYGYGYPRARAVLGGRPGEELDELEWLADGGYLARHFVDKIHLCPFCGHFALSFREVCPRCRSANVDIVEMIHHFRCGYVGPEAEFRDGIRFLCPKCRRPVRHVGVDYDRPTANYLCGSCGHVFVDPPVVCRCLHSGEEFDVARARVRTIYAYEPTEEAALVVARGRFGEEDAARVYLDEELAVYRYRFFEEQLGQEVREGRRYEKPVSILLARAEGLDAVRERLGHEEAARLWRTIVQTAKEQLRDCDIPARADDATLAILLPGTSVEGAAAAARRIEARVAEVVNGDRGVRLSIGLAGLFADGEDPERLVEAARRRLERSRGETGSEPRADTGRVE